MRSAGLLVYRRRDRGIEVFLVHPGGPYFRKRDEGWWSVPKGVLEGDEEPLERARREFEEETGRTVEACGGGSDLLDLGEITQKSGKVVHGWAFEGEWPEGVEVASNTFELEWPPHSGRRQEFPEVDRGSFFGLEEARRKINGAQAAFLDRLVDHLD